MQHLNQKDRTFNLLINNNTNLLEWHDYVAQILKFFISWNKNINNDNKDLLDLNTIKRLNSILLPYKSIGSFIPLSNYINSENICIIDK